MKIPNRAIAAHTKQTSDRAAGTFTAPSESTVREDCQQRLAGRRLKPATRAAYEFALDPMTERYGARLVQKMSKTDIEKLVVELCDVTGPRGAGRTPL
ncbi:hypothetical protein [Tsukamurella soli]|uniref:Integrase SAM-like N-terminal domain-containing protein n=1 Tax=Tsukamurella soli TaxID=644556 RepID=A0ABP8K944_9ACTN